ncbi:MAG: DUF86 domain-containing protein [Candidatus Freyarchaeum deiterrae]
MKEGRDYRDFLVDILNAIGDIDNFVEDLDFESFVDNKEKLYATVYCLQIIGEAVKNIPEEIKKKYKKIPWREIAGMRDKLTHGYFVVDFERVWETVKRDLPPLKEIINKISKEI